MSGTLGAWLGRSLCLTWTLGACLGRSLCLTGTLGGCLVRSWWVLCVTSAKLCVLCQLNILCVTYASSVCYINQVLCVTSATSCVTSWVLCVTLSCSVLRDLFLCVTSAKSVLHLNQVLCGTSAKSVLQLAARWSWNESPLQLPRLSGGNHAVLWQSAAQSGRPAGRCVCVLTWQSAARSGRPAGRCVCFFGNLLPGVADLQVCMLLDSFKTRQVCVMIRTTTSSSRWF